MLNEKARTQHSQGHWTGLSEYSGNGGGSYISALDTLEENITFKNPIKSDKIDPDKIINPININPKNVKAISPERKIYSLPKSINYSSHKLPDLSGSGTDSGTANNKPKFSLYEPNIPENPLNTPRENEEMKKRQQRQAGLKKDGQSSMSSISNNSSNNYSARNGHNKTVLGTKNSLSRIGSGRKKIKSLGREEALHQKFRHSLSLLEATPACRNNLQNLKKKRAEEQFLEYLKKS